MILSVTSRIVLICFLFIEFSCSEKKNDNESLTENSNSSVVETESSTIINNTSTDTSNSDMNTNNKSSVVGNSVSDTDVNNGINSNVINNSNNIQPSDLKPSKSPEQIEKEKQEKINALREIQSQGGENEQIISIPH